METTDIPPSEWELLLRATINPVPELIAVELGDEAQVLETERRLQATRSFPPPLRVAFQPARDPPAGLWERAAEKVPAAQRPPVPLLLAVDQLWRVPPGPALEGKLAAFWKGMNQLRERWHSLEAQIVFLLSPLSYRHLTLNADHLKRWMSLKLHFKPMATGFGEVVRSEAEFVHLEPFGHTDLLRPEAARQQLETLSLQLAEARLRSEPEPVLVRRYYLPLFAAAVSAGEYDQADEFRGHIRTDHLRDEERDQWRRLNAVCDRRGAGAEFDVFLSHSGKDKAAARALERLLAAQGVRVWFDEDQLMPGRPWQPLMEAGIKASRCGLILVGADGIGPWEDEEMQAMLRLVARDKRPLLPVLLPGAPAQPALPLFLANRTWVDLRSGYTDEAVAKLLWAITGQRPQRLVSPSPLLSPSRVRHSAARLIGREPELAALDRAWNQSATHILTIVAWGGVGKTSLVVEWMARKAQQGWPGFERVFDWCFYDQGPHEEGVASADSFITAALEFFGDAALARSAASPWDKGARLAQLVAQRRSLLVLDGLEPLQDPSGSPAGKLKAPAIEALLKGLAANNAGLCIVTSREGLPDLEPWVDKTVRYLGRQGQGDRHYPMLRRLPPAAAVALLKTCGVRGTEAEFQQLVEDVRGHALTLNLLGRYLARAHGGDIRRCEQVDFERADAQVQGGHAFKTMAAYERWLKNAGAAGARQVAVLRLLGLFDREADAGSWAALRRAPVLPGLTDPLVGLAEDDWNRTLSALSESGLITMRTGESLSSNADLVIDAHPLIRSYFRKSLEDTEREAKRAAHARLHDHLIQYAPTMRPTSWREMELLYRAATHLLLAGRERAAFFELYRQRISLGDWGYATRQFGSFSAEFAFLRHFYEYEWSEPRGDFSTDLERATVNRCMGFCLWPLGRTDDADVLMRRALTSGRRVGHSDTCAITARNLASLHLSLGNLCLAEGLLRDNLDHADRTSDKFMPVGFRCSLAHILLLRHGASATSQVERLFSEALEWQKKRGARFTVLGQLPGSQYWDYLNACGRHAEVLKLVRQAAGERASEAGIVADGLEKLALAVAAAGQGERSRASRLFDEACHALRASGRDDLLAGAFVARAGFRAKQGDFSGAQSDLDEAWQIAERGRTRLHLADIRLSRARLFFREKPYPWASPQADLTAARRLIEACGYWRRKEELEDAEKVILGRQPGT